MTWAALEHWCRQFPVATVSTVAFYASVLLLVYGPYRRWVGNLFAPPTPSSRAYSGALDGYRGLAAWMVAFGHCIWWCYPVFWSAREISPYLLSNGGNKAVPIFVLLSGFLIYRSVRKIDSADDLRDYVRRRFLRIYPLYFAAVVAVFALGQLPTKPRTVFPEVFMLRAFGYPTFGNPPAWSLYVEVAFYVFLPIFVIAAGRKIVFAAIAAFVALAVGDPYGPREMYLWKFFFLGILTSHLADWLARVMTYRGVREVVGLAMVVGALKLLYYDLGGKDADWVSKYTKIPHNNAENTIGLGLGFGLLVAGTMLSGVWSRLAGVAPLRFLGTISYSIFLLHPFYILANFPQLEFAKVGQAQPFCAAIGPSPWWFPFIGFAPGMLLWAAASYAIIERPFLKMRPSGTKPTTLPMPQPSVEVPAERKAA